MKKNIIKIGITLGILSPFVAFAQQKDLDWLVKLIIKYLNIGIYLILALALIMFVWNVFKYFIAGGDNTDSKKEAGLYVMWSLIGFFVILSFYGLVRILVNTFNLDSGTPSSLFGTFRSSSNFSGNPQTNATSPTIFNPQTNATSPSGTNSQTNTSTIDPAYGQEYNPSNPNNPLYNNGQPIYPAH